MVNANQITGLAPRRYRLTKNLAGTFTPRLGVDHPSLSTWLFIVPIETHCYAVRLGFANPYGFAQTIVSAAVYPSDSYSDASLALSKSNTAVNPTGGVTGTPIGWECGNGCDTPAINDQALVRTHVLPGDPTNRQHDPRPYTIAWSDFCPCASIPRQDGSPQPLLFIYVTLGGTDFVGGPLAIRAFNTDPVAVRGRPFFGLRATTLGRDFVDEPTATNWSSLGEPPFAPALWLQYLTLNPGYQIVQVGDSLSCGPDGYSPSLWRAAMDLSTPVAPIEFCSMAWAGTGTQVYDTAMANNAESLRPSILSAQPISRNNGFTAASIRMLLARKLAQIDALAAFQTQLIWNIPACSSLGDNNEQIAIFRAFRAQLLERAAAGGDPVIDGPAVMGDWARNAPWNYAPGYSDDGLHPNSAATEAVVPAATDTLRKQSGKGLGPRGAGFDCRHRGGGTPVTKIGFYHDLRRRRAGAAGLGHRPVKAPQQRFARNPIAGGVWPTVRQWRTQEALTKFRAWTKQFVAVRHRQRDRALYRDDVFGRRAELCKRHMRFWHVQDR
jgi:hypothetical protein